jgi:hypothetical protein
MVDKQHIKRDKHGVAQVESENKLIHETEVQPLLLQLPLRILSPFTFHLPAHLMPIICRYHGKTKGHENKNPYPYM